MIKKLFISVFLMFGFWMTMAQKLQMRAEANYLRFQYVAIDVDPAAGYRGPDLDRSGAGGAVIGGVGFANEKLFLGVGGSYWKFHQYGSWSVFTDLEYIPFSWRLSPLVALRLGTNKIWNQYEGGKRGFFRELSLGMRFKIDEKNVFYLKGGGMYLHDSLLFPFSLGYQFSF